MEFDVNTKNVIVLVGDIGDRVYTLDYDYRNGYFYFPKIDLQEIVRYVEIYLISDRKQNKLLWIIREHKYFNLLNRKANSVIYLYVWISIKSFIYKTTFKPMVAFD